MKYMFSFLSLLLFLVTANIGFTQNMSEKEWKKRVVGKTIAGHGLNMKFNKDGSFNGTWTANGKINQIRGKWTYTKAKGYCRDLTIILGNGQIVDRGEACQKMNFKSNGKAEIQGKIYTLK